MDIKLDVVAIILAIASPIVAWLLLLLTSTKKRATADTEVLADIKAIKLALENLNHVVGNGGYGGLRDTIKAMEIEMRGLKEQVRAIQADITDLKTSDVKNTIDRENDARNARNREK